MSVYRHLSQPQTIQKLVLRKRTTSPYQIKLPFMVDRLRAPRRPSRTCAPSPVARKTSGEVPSIRTVAPVQHVATELRSGCGSAPPSTTGRSPTTAGCATLQCGDSFAAFGRGSFEDTTNTSPQDALSSEDPSLPGLSTPSPAVEAVADGPARSPLTSLDTWSEICEELCRAKEVFAGISGVGVPNSYAFDAPLSCSSTQDRSIPGASPSALFSTPNALPSPTCTIFAGPWSSYVLSPKS
ncbi:hypothetical protein BV20DRAFT_464859 [Pilatotrama ljubarskyi]|nr:hypothetical protein BV20DRAFT_464859 [Pilatotrama ljubarskyi]